MGPTLIDSSCPIQGAIKIIQVTERGQAHQGEKENVHINPDRYIRTHTASPHPTPEDN